MKTLHYYTLLLLFIAAPLWGIAQTDDNHTLTVDIPEVALVDIEGASGTNITLNVEAPSEAGGSIDLSNSKDSSLWLNYSSVTGSQTEPRREVYAKISQGTVPSALRLRLVASQDAGFGDGKLGIPTNEKSLTGTDKRIIRNIRTAYTGDGVGKGHRLTYSLKLRNNRYNQLDFDESTSLTVLYTITDQ
jgi:hypothetical protein